MADTFIGVAGGFNARNGPYWISPLIAATVVQTTPYRTLDGGATWTPEAPLTGMAGTQGLGPAGCWFDRQTPGNNGTRLHFLYVLDPGGTGTEDVRYVNYNIATGVWSTPLELATDHNQLSTTSVAFTVVTRSGNIIVGYCDPNSAQSAAWKSTTAGVTFTAIANPFESNEGDIVLGACPNTGDGNDAAILFWDISADAISVKMYDDSANTWTETAIASSMIDTAGGAERDWKEHWSTNTRLSDGHTLLAAWNQIDNAAADIQAWDLTLDSIATPTVTAKTNVVSNLAESGGIGLFIDQVNEHVYATYCKGGTWLATTDVVYRKSTDGMATWSAETVYSTSAADDSRTVFAGAMGSATYGGTFAPMWLRGTDAYIGGGALTLAPVPHAAFVLMLAQESDKDTPVLDITAQNVAEPGAVLTKIERGRERAVLGEPPRAGAGSTHLANYKMQHYDVEHPLPGLALRLNKFVDDVEYNLWTGDLDVPKHSMTNWRPVVDLKAFGRMSRLSGRKVTTALYEDILVGDAIEVVLDAAGVPDSLRDIASGVVTLNYFWASEEDALSLINKLVATEGITADWCEDGLGRFTFRDRNARYTDTRSAVVQNVIVSDASGARPWLSGFDYESGYREIVNQAKHPRKTRLADNSPSVVWSEAANYLLVPNQAITIYATSSEPFKDAITPVLGTDYTVAWGSVTVTLDQTSGSRVGMTFTAGAIGAAFGYDNSTVLAMQLRATSIPQLGTDIVEQNTIPATDSILQYGLKPWTGEMWPDVEWFVIRDNLDAIVAWKQTPRGRITVTVEASLGVDENLLTAARKLGDRLEVIESELGVDAEVWIERVEHEVRAPQRHIATYECSVIHADITANPYDSINNEAYVIPPDIALADTHVSPTQSIMAGAA